MPRYSIQQSAPPVLGSDPFIPPLRVPATFGTYPGPSRNPIGVPAIPAPGMVVRQAERRHAVIAQARTAATVTVARASRNARQLVGMVASRGR